MQTLGLKVVTFSRRCDEATEGSSLVIDIAPLSKSADEGNSFRFGVRRARRTVEDACKENLNRCQLLL